MIHDEIAQYTNNENILEMQDFRDMPEDERLEDDAYTEAQAILVEGVQGRPHCRERHGCPAKDTG